LKSAFSPLGFSQPHGFSLRWERLLLITLLLLTASGVLAQQLADTDGDGVPDNYDSCPTQAGAAENYGCPAGVVSDFDQDGVPDTSDLCFNTPGTAQYSGCTADTYPDDDGDGVVNFQDACPEQAGDASNGGCPAGVSPDSDHDGVPDASDACPQQAGPAANNGCQPDADGDKVPDTLDACPQQAGVPEDYGCPAGVPPPDSDGDTLPDIADTCPNQPGNPQFGGCPDSDGDTVPDSYDACPHQVGDPMLLGCLAVTQTTLPQNRAALTNASAASVHEVATLTIGSPIFAPSPGGIMAVRSSNDLLTYNLNAPQLTPLLQVTTGWSGYPVAISPSGDTIATYGFNPQDFSPLIQLWSGQTGQSMSTLSPKLPTQTETWGVSALSFSPAGNWLAVAQQNGAGFNATPSVVPIWDTTTNTLVAQLPHPDQVVHLAFNRDGSRLATDTAEGSSMMVYVWDVASQTKIATLPITPVIHFNGTPMAFSPDGSALAVGSPDGSLGLWDIASASPRYLVSLFNADAGEVVSAVALSPDGSLIAAAGGMAFSGGGGLGGLTGTEQFTIYLLDAVTGQTLATLTGHKGLVNTLAFSPDGTLLISSGDVTLRFWGIG
jgi:WD40 repeat protein